jgi:hypothetical protein
MMEKKPYIKPECIAVPYVEPLMGFDDASTGTDEAFAKENDTFFNEDNDYDLWSDFVPFEEE